MTRVAVKSIVGEPLSAVAFVQDYVEFYFDGRILRALTNASLTSGGVTWTFPEQGSRDAFCRLIGHSVRRVDVEDGQKIEVVFTDGATLLIPLDASALSGPEGAHFVPGENQPIDVW
jgi:hypothetical protein